jgi:hypothetical protein
MSGIVHAIGKVFKVVVKAVKGVVHWIADNWKAIVIAAAIIYTGGLAAGAWGAAGAAGAGGAAAGAGTAAAAGTAGAAAATGAEATVGIMAGSTAASTAAAAAGGTFGIGAATIGTSSLAAGITAGGVAAGGAGATAAAGYTLSQGAATGSSAISTGGQLGADAASVGGGSMPQAGLLQSSTAAGTGTGDAFTSAYTGMQQLGPDALSNSVTSGTPGGWWDSTKSFGSNLKSDAIRLKGDVFGSAPTDQSAAASTTGTAAPAASSGMPTWAKLQLASTAFNGISGYLQGKAANAPPRNFSGRGAQGGVGIGMHLTNNGFGIAAGGSTPAASGPPAGLLPPGSDPNQQPSYVPPSLSDAAAPSQGSTQQGNIGQTVANQAGVGGLVPQGAVDFMGQNRHG